MGTEWGGGAGPAPGFRAQSSAPPAAAVGGEWEVSVLGGVQRRREGSGSEGVAIVLLEFPVTRAWA